MPTRPIALISALLVTGALWLVPAQAGQPEFSITQITSSRGGKAWRIPVPAGVSVRFSVEAILRDSPLDDTAAVFAIAKDFEGKIVDWFASATLVSTFDREGEETTVKINGNGQVFGHPSSGMANISWHVVGTGTQTAPSNEPWTLYAGGFASSGAEYLVTLDGLGSAPAIAASEVDGSKVEFSSLSESEALATVEGPPVGSVSTGATWTYSASGLSFFLGVPTYTPKNYSVSSGFPEQPEEMQIFAPDGTIRCTCEISDSMLWRGAVHHFTAGPRRSSNWADAVTLPSTTAGMWTVKLAATVNPLAAHVRGWFIDLGTF